MKLTLRNYVNIVLAAVCALAFVVLSTGIIHAAWAPKVAALAFGLLVGLVTPGSPVGRYLDTLLPAAHEASK